LVTHPSTNPAKQGLTFLEQTRHGTVLVV